MLPFGPWEPDKGPFSTASTDYVLNVQPISNGWAPLPDPSQISVTLGGQCYGGTYYRSSSGAFGVIACTKDRIYKLNTGVAIPYTWTDISGPSAPYAVPDGQLWQFERFQTKLFATQLNAPLQVLDVDAGVNFADAPGSPPRAKYIAAVGDFLVLAYLKVGATESPQSWFNSAIADVTANGWTAGVNLADDQDIAAGDEIVGIIGGPAGGVLLQRHAKRPLILTADADMPIKSSVIDPKYGCIAPYSIIQIGGGDYVYLDEDGFKRGNDRVPIGTERINKYFFEQCSLDSLELVQGCADPYNHIAWWTYTNNNNTKVAIGWDWELDRWMQADYAATMFFPLVTPGMTLEALTAAFAALYGVGSVDAPGAASMDSRLWKGGRPIWGMLGSADNILYGMTGPTRAATLDTSRSLISGNSMKRSGVTWARFVGDTDTVSAAIGFADTHGQAITYKTAQAASTKNGLIPAKGEGLLARARVTIAGGVDWNFAHGIELEGPAGGGQ
jgi:hypothetical protein